MHPPLPPRSIVLLLPALLGACSWFPRPEKPRISLTPVVGFMELSGQAQMESFGTTGKVRNPWVDVESELNLGDRETGVGGTVAYMDDFQGLEVHYFRWEEKNFETTGLLQSDFGNLDRADQVGSEVLLNQLRIHYLAQIFEESEWTEATFRLGLGAGLHHNIFRLESQSQGTPPERTQTLKFHDDGLPMLLGRFQADWQPFRLRVDAGWMEGHFGNINGTVWDLSARLEYRVQRGIWLWGGYWRYDLPAKGTKDFLEYRFDMDLQGYIAGLRFEF